MPNANRSNIYRTLVHFDINKVPQERKQQASIFKEYDFMSSPFCSRKKVDMLRCFQPNLGGEDIIRVVRTLTWLELDDLTDSIVACMPNANRSNVYRLLLFIVEKKLICYGNYHPNLGGV
jgi:hypothetical protein